MISMRILGCFHLKSAFQHNLTRSLRNFQDHSNVQDISLRGQNSQKSRVPVS
jgi:hypothetical protein